MFIKQAFTRKKMNEKLYLHSLFMTKPFDPTCTLSAEYLAPSSARGSDFILILFFSNYSRKYTFRATGGRSVAARGGFNCRSVTNTHFTWEKWISRGWAVYSERSKCAREGASLNFSDFVTARRGVSCVAASCCAPTARAIKIKLLSGEKWQEKTPCGYVPYCCRWRHSALTST